MTVELAAELLIDAEAATLCVRAVLVGMLREGGPSTLAQRRPERDFRPMAAAAQHPSVSP
jgi:hypothetical protein